MKKNHERRQTKLVISPLVRILAVLVILFSSSSEAEPKATLQKLHFASTSWCPYICDDKDQPGFIVEYMSALLATEGIELAVDILPWSRAIALARKGHYDGLLTAVESEAPDFHLTQFPTGTYQVCLYKKSGSHITYENRRSFQNLIFGGIKDYGYGEPIDSLISNPQENEKAYLISHNKPLEALVHMTHRDRIDLFAEDSAVIELKINNKPLLDLVEIAGCLDEVPFYTAVSPKHSEKARLLARLNTLLNLPSAKVLYSEAKHRYLN